MASEMLAQLEHDPDAAGICIASSSQIAKAVNEHAVQQFKGLNRQAIITESKQNALVSVISNESEALDAINYCASEHLVLLSDNAEELRKQVKHAGSIFCGPYSR